MDAMSDIDEIRRANLRLLEAEAGSTTAAAKRCEMTPSQFANLRDGAKDSKTGKPRGMRKETARRVDAAFGKPAGWLDVDRSARAHANVALAPIGARSVPVISAIQAGMWAEIADNFAPGDADDWLMTDLELSASAFALTIRGDSMLPEFNPGDRVIIDPDVAPHPGDFVAAKNGEQEATFKKYRPRGMDAQGNMVFELVPLNEDYPTLRSDVQPIRIVGTMVEHRKYRRPR